MRKLKNSAGLRLVKPGKPLPATQASYVQERSELVDEFETDRLVLKTKYLAFQESLEELNQSRFCQEAYYDFAPVGYVILDHIGCIKKINLTAASLIGMKRFQLIGVPLSVFVTTSDLKFFLDHLRKCKSCIDEKVSTELRLTTNSGQVQVQLLSIPFKSASGSIVYETFITDISERKHYEEVLARLDRLNLVGEMAAGIGQEVRNPLTTVRGFLQLYRQKDAFTQYQDSFDLMLDELDRANLIITEFLALAKNKETDTKAQNLNAILRNLAPLYQANMMVADKYIDLQLEEIPDFPMNEKEIRQLILNLVRNGLEAMSTAGKLTIRTYLDDKNVVLSVQDQGKGIKPELLKKIGTPFVITKSNGTGLGLMVCYGIAARHNAVINIETSPSGTTFFVRFRTA